MESNFNAKIVPMHFYTNWDSDVRTSSSAMSRVLSMVLTRLVFAKTFRLSETTSMVLAIKLKGQRRILRSSDITVSPCQQEYLMEISLIIQYCHFVKKRSNVLQILLQRRKRYRNRQIPGYKTLAFGCLNLDEVLQKGGPYQISLWDHYSHAAYLNKSHRSSIREFPAGAVFISNCFTHQSTVDISTSSGWAQRPTSSKQNFKRMPVNFDSSTALVKDSDAVIQSDDDEYSSGAESSEFDEFGEIGTSRISHHSSGRSAKDRGHQRKYKEILKQKNIKQKLASLLRRFRPEDEAMGVGTSNKDIILPETEYELQEIFDELNDNISDYSGPDLIEDPDRMSTVTNPRPGLRPFFGSRSTVLTTTAAILGECDRPEQPLSDELHSGDSLLFADIDDQTSSADNEDPPPEPKPQSLDGETIIKLAEPESIKHVNQPDFIPLQESPKSHLPPRRPLVRHSSTINMPSGGATSLPTEKHSLAQNKPFPSTLASLIAHLEDTTMTPTSIIPSYLWICSTADLPWLSKINSRLLGSVWLVDCPTSAEVNVVLQAFVNRIQKFCHTNSVAPSTTTIGILGGDQLLSNVLQSYVQLLQHKACQDEWLNYLRFSLVVPPTSAVGRLLAQVADGGYSEAAWKALNRIATHFEGSDQTGPVEHSEIHDCLLFGIADSTPKRTTNLNIGEVMLQLTNTTAVVQETPNKSQIFVPLLAELLSRGEERAESGAEAGSLSFRYMSDSSNIAPMKNVNTAREPFDSPSGRTDVVERSGTAPSSAFGFGPSNRLLHKFREGFGITKSLEAEANLPYEEEYASRKTEKPQTSAKNEASPTAFSSSGSSPASASGAQIIESRELHIEYWVSGTSATPLPPESSTTMPSSITPSISSNLHSGGKFSIKASIRMLSVAREPMSNLLSILFVKDRKKDNKVLQKLGRKSKMRPVETSSIVSGRFDTQSRVVSGVSRVVCMCGNLGDSKRVPLMDVFIDGVLWHRVRYFQVSPQWQTHVKMFPVSFPLVPTVNVWPISC